MGEEEDLRVRVRVLGGFEAAGFVEAEDGGGGEDGEEGDVYGGGGRGYYCHFRVFVPLGNQ